MKFVKRKYILVLIILLAFALRFFMLGQNPPSLNWDETSIGYNAYSILKTGKDEYGNFLPLEFRSFDDYKPPIYVYLTVPSIFIFGLTEFAVRFPAALFGTLSVVVFYFLLKEATSDYKKGDKIALLGSFLLAISPWHLQFSRAAYEGNIGLFFIMLGCFLFYKSLKNNKLIFLSAASFLLSTYSYHSFRMVVPFLILFLTIIFWKKLFRIKKTVIISALFFIILSLPIYIGFFSPQGTQSRLAMVTIFGESDGIKRQLSQLEADKKDGNIIGQIFHNRRLYYFKEGAKNYFDHFSPNYLFVIGAGSFHHHAYDMGMMYLLELPFLLLGIIYFAKKITKKSMVLIMLLILAPLPAAITSGTPHGVRSIAMIPGLLFIVSLGIIYFKEILSNLKNSVMVRIIIFALFSVAIINFIYYMNQYYTATPRFYGYFWLAGNKEAILKAKELENKYEKIIMSYEYDQPYIYYLFYNKIDPHWYQKYWNDFGRADVKRDHRVIGKYEFKNISGADLEKSKNTLFIGAPWEISDPNPIDVIYFPDGRVAYKIKGT